MVSFKIIGIFKCYTHKLYKQTHKLSWNYTAKYIQVEKLICEIFSRKLF